MAVNVYKLEGASLDTNAAPAPTKGTASIKLIGVAEKAATTEPEALELRAESTAWCRLEMLLPPLPRNGLGEPGHHCEEPQTCTGAGLRHHYDHCKGACPRANMGQTGTVREAVSRCAGCTRGLVGLNF